MAYNGSGTFSRTNGTNSGATTWTLDKAAGTKIRSDRHDTHDQDIADGLSNAICKDGQTTITANIPFNSKKITGLGDGTAHTDAAGCGQVQDNTFNFGGISAGTANAQTISLSPAITAYANGLLVFWRSNYNNTAATVTLNVNGQGAKQVTDPHGDLLVPGTLGSGDLYGAIYSSASGKLHLLNPIGPWKTWSPTYGAGGSMTYTSVSTSWARYKVVGNIVFFTISASGTTGGSAYPYITFTLPTTPIRDHQGFDAWLIDSTDFGGFAWFNTGTGVVNLAKSSLANFGLGASRSFYCSGFYEAN